MTIHAVILLIDLRKITTIHRKKLTAYLFLINKLNE